MWFVMSDGTSRIRRIREARIGRFGRPPNHKAVSIKVLIQIEHFRPPASRGPFGAVSGPPELEAG